MSDSKPATSPIQKYRGSYVSLAVWILLIGVFGIPFTLMPMAFIPGHAGEVVGLGLYGGLILFTIVRYVMLRVEIGPDYVRKSGVFGTQRIALTPETSFRYNMIVTRPGGTGLIEGLIVGAATSMLSETSKTNYTLHVRSGRETMRLTSSIKDIHRIAEFFQRFETETVLPHLRQMIDDGLRVDSGPLAQDESHVYRGQTVIPKPLGSAPALKEGVLTFPYNSGGRTRNVKVKWRDLWNPFATCALIGKR